MGSWQLILALPYLVIATYNSNFLIIITGSDFTALDTVLNLYSYSRTKCADININYDYVSENSEIFTVSLSAGSGLPSYVTLSPTSATVRIYNEHSE